MFARTVLSRRGERREAQYGGDTKDRETVLRAEIDAGNDSITFDDVRLFAVRIVTAALGEVRERTHPGA